jgi:hypothetical protein
LACANALAVLALAVLWLPEMAGEVSARGLLVALLFAGLAAATFCLALTWGARRLSRGTVWAISGLAVGSVVVVALVGLLRQSLIREQLGFGFTLLFVSALMGLPSAAAVWMALRRAARPQASHLVLDFVLVATTFIVALPVGAIVASIPDIVALLK